MLFNSFEKFLETPGPVIRKVDNPIHRINQYPADSVVCFVNTYPLDNDLSSIAEFKELW